MIGGLVIWGRDNPARQGPPVFSRGKSFIFFMPKLTSDQPNGLFYVLFLSILRLFGSLFRAQEPKAPVTYCDHALSGVRRPSSVVCRPSSVVCRPLDYYIFDFFSRTAWWILMKLGMDEVLKVPYKCCCFSARSVQGRIQGGAKIGHGGSASSGNFFFRPEGYSNKPNA